MVILLYGNFFFSQDGFNLSIYIQLKQPAEEPGNPVVPAGALQPGGQKILQGTAA